MTGSPVSLITDKARVHETTPREKQRAASDPSASVWVNASAGSGKTTILTRRVTRLLLAGVAPEKILCLTYTRAGAAEMTNRITSLFSRWVSCDDAALDGDLDELQSEFSNKKPRSEARRLFARVLSCPGGLRIRTIHSFCQEILSRFPIEAGLPPHFSLIDEFDKTILEKNALDDLLRDIKQYPDTDLAQAMNLLISDQGEHGFAGLAQTALSEAKKLTVPLSDLIVQTRRFLQLSADDTSDGLRRAAIEQLPEKSLGLLADWLTQDPSAKQKKRGLFLRHILSTARPDRTAYFEDYKFFFLTQKHEPFSESSFASKLTRETYPDLIPLCMREASRLLSFLERIEAAETAERTASVLIFGHALAMKVARAKKARAVMDYDDLILRTESLLCRAGINPWIRYKLDNGIDHVLVDEAQDTSRAQWNIVEALTSEFTSGEGARHERRTLFVVGDEKQSIFSFQNADPAAFHGFRALFAQKFAATGEPLREIGYHTSFRSAPAILRAIDKIFENVEAQDGVSSDTIRHTPFHAHKIGHVEVWPLFENKTEESENSEDGWILPITHEEDHDPQVELAQTIARKIALWLSSDAPLSGTGRSIRPGDIMILLRRRGSFADLMVRALKAQHIAVTGVDRMHLVRQLPVMDLLALLRFVLLPENDLNLATVLRGPLIGIDEDELLHLAVGREGALWDQVKTNPGLQPIHTYLSAQLAQADFTTPFSFLSQILNTPCPANIISGRMAIWSRLGDESLDPIEELLNEAQSFGHAHPPSLENFLHWLVKADTEIKREMDSGDKKSEGRVRIMTVHAAKGLEAPIVFLPDAASVPQASHVPKFQWSKDGAPLYLARKPSSGAARDIWQAARDAQMQEYRRLFYVALTRAEQQLYICGWKSRHNDPQSWFNLAQLALKPLHDETIRCSEPRPDIVLGDSETRMTTEKYLPKTAVKKSDLPLWARQVVPMTEALRSRSAQGSLITDDFPDAYAASPDVAFTRGRIIHRLLQSLPDIAPLRREAAMARFLAQPQYNLSEDARTEISEEVEKLINNPALAPIFASDSRAEVALTGTISGVNTFRQIDRLCLCGDEVWIVDYKTNRPPPLHEHEIPLPYRAQLMDYRTLIQGIYPTKRIRSFLLWTYSPCLMEIIF